MEVPFSTLLNKGERINVGGVVGHIERKDCFNPPQATTYNPNPNQPCSHYKVYGHDVNHCFMFHPNLQQGQSQMGNAMKFWQGP